MTPTPRSGQGRTARAPEAMTLYDLMVLPRTTRINGVRAAPEVKAMLEEVLRRKGQSFADWTVEKIEEDSNGYDDLPDVRS